MERTWLNCLGLSLLIHLLLALLLPSHLFLPPEPVQEEPIWVHLIEPAAPMLPDPELPLQPPPHRPELQPEEILPEIIAPDAGPGMWVEAPPGSLAPVLSVDASFLPHAPSHEPPLSAQQPSLYAQEPWEPAVPALAPPSDLTELPYAPVELSATPVAPGITPAETMPPMGPDPIERHLRGETRVPLNRLVLDPPTMHPLPTSARLFQPQVQNDLTLEPLAPPQTHFSLPSGDVLPATSPVPSAANQIGRAHV